ncbi:MAG: DinB family protein [Chloroflexia bacterium]|nr:DinB family protein [Chloroflexia bacterium]
MTRKQLLARLDAAWVAFQNVHAGLSDEELLESGVVDDWSVKDLVAHVTWWEEEALKHLPLILAGERPPRYSVTYGGIDAFNTLMAVQTRDLSLDDVRRQANVTHRRLVDYIRGVPEELFARETRFRRRLRLDTYSHYPIHTTAIREWREQRFT